jgi:hypothetical protein
MQAFPPSRQDQDYHHQFAPLGLLDPASPYAHCAPELAQALTAGTDAAKQQMQTALTAGGSAPVVNGWTLTFDQDPPVDAFWSITMYDLPDFYLVANPINRYSIGDRTPGLRRDPGGSLVIVIQHDQPADPSNWLPAPAAPFRPFMHLYLPKAAVLDGTYKIPPITKAADQ